MKNLLTTLLIITGVIVGSTSVATAGTLAPTAVGDLSYEGFSDYVLSAVTSGDQ